jgi:glycosyltransferase involved in cell wall biosynthesis
LSTFTLASDARGFAGEKPAPGARLIALLGKLETPTDGVDDYCQWLALALGRSGWELERRYLPWPKGWLPALFWLWRESRNWKGRWVCLQYTAFSWSRSGFNVGVLSALWILRRRGARCAMVLHDPGPCSGNRWIDRLRRAVQVPVLRASYRLAERSIFTVDLAKATWLSGDREKAVFIPVGANLPGTSPAVAEAASRRNRPKEVSVFCFTGGVHARREAEDIAYAVSHAAKHAGPIRVVVLGRNAQLGEGPLREALANTGVEIEVHGVLPAEVVEQRLSHTDVLVFVRGGISTRRGSAIAGIACGLPVVSYSWRETGPPITDAGVALVPSGDRQALAEALTRVLSDDVYRAQLRRRSLSAREQHFSWDAIAAKYRAALGCSRHREEQNPRNMVAPGNGTDPSHYAPGNRTLTHE